MKRKAVAQPGKGGHVKAGLVLERSQRVVVESRDKDVIDEVLHRLAAAAVCQRDSRDVDLAEAARPDGLDDVHAAPACSLMPPYW